MALEIRKGKKKLPARIVLYGVEGVGKSTFGAGLPKPFFLCAEGGADEIGVDRAIINKEEDLLEAWEYLKANMNDFDSIVIDSIDWLEGVISARIAKDNNVEIIENIKWSKGGVFLQREVKKLLTGPLDYFRNQGKIICLIAHAEIDPFKDPSLQESFDRYTLKSHKKTKDIIKEWCDWLMFANYEQEQIGDSVLTSGKRITFSNHSSSKDAKNRFSIPDGIELNYKNFENFFKNKGGKNVK